MNAYRTSHQYDRYNHYCVRCYARRSAIEEGFVNVLCGGVSVGRPPDRLALQAGCYCGIVIGAVLMWAWFHWIVQ